MLKRLPIVLGRSAVSEEKSIMSQPIRGQGGHLNFSIDPKNTYLVEDVEILLPVEFHEIPFSGFRGEVENVSANQKPGRPSRWGGVSPFFSRGSGGPPRIFLAYCYMMFTLYRDQEERFLSSHRRGGGIGTSPRKFLKNGCKWCLMSPFLPITC